MTDPDTVEKDIPLSQREQEILRLVATGATNQQIATRLDITLSTVKVHLRNIFAKIGVASRTEASLYAVRMGLVVIDLPLKNPSPPTAEPPPNQATAELPPDSATALSTAERADAQVSAPLTRRLSPLLVTAALALLLIGAIIAGLRFFSPAPTLVPTASVIAPSSTPPSAWRSWALMSVPRSGFGITSADGRIFIIGGMVAGEASGIVERYNPQSDTWTTLTAKPTPVAYIQAVSLNGKIYVPGGQTADGSISDHFEMYDPQQDTWTSLSPLPAPRSDYTTAVLAGKIYLFGGWNGQAHQDNVWVFDPDVGSWEPEAPMPTARSGMAAVIIEGNIHLLGGRSTDTLLTLHQTYNPAQAESRRWQVLAPLPQPVNPVVAVNIINNIYAFDPATGVGIVYDDQSDAWRRFTTSLPPGSSSLAAVLVNTSIYFLGSGPDGAAFALSYEAISRTQLPFVSVDRQP